MNRAIGVIDSGVGGLTVAYELMRQLPNEKLIYVGDTMRCPYGPRPEHEVKQFTMEMVHFLLEKDVKMIVIACNTATAFTIKQLKEKLSIPVIGVIKPGARAAINATNNKQIGVIGTEGTIRSESYVRALHKINHTLGVTTLACPTFVPMVEKGITDGEEAFQVVAEALEPLRTVNIDTLVLGCTHYPILQKTIQQVVGHDVQLISSSEETARETSAILEVHHLLQKNVRTAKHQFYMTGNLETFTKLSNIIFENCIECLQDVMMDKINLPIQV